MDDRQTEPDPTAGTGAAPSKSMRCSGRVLIDGTPAKVGARAFDVLLALVERRERVVPKRELMDLVWPKLVVEEGNLLGAYGGAAQAARSASDRHHSGPRLSLRDAGRRRDRRQLRLSPRRSVSSNSRQPAGLAAAVRSRAGPGRSG